MRTTWTGCATALVTPFTSDDRVDESAVRRLARRQIDAGIHFLVPCGTTGESPTLSAAERRRVVELVVEEAVGKVPVLAGAGGYDTNAVVRAAAEMASAGAQGLLSVTPYYNKPTQEGLYRHFRTIADSTPLPVVLYNVPGRTGANLAPATVARLAGVPNIVGIKEASGDMTQISRTRREVPDDFLVLSGDDGLTLPVMAVGGQGVISVAANEAPELMVRLVEAADAGDFAGARRLHTELLPLMLGNFLEPNPIPVKAAMALMGLLDERYRLPLTPPAPAVRDQLTQILSGLALLPSQVRP